MSVTEKLREYIQKRETQLRDFAMQVYDLRNFLQNLLQIIIEHVETLKSDILELAKRIDELEKNFD